MSTSEPFGGAPPSELSSGPSAVDFAAMAGEVARLANQFLGVAPALNAGETPATTLATPGVGALSPELIAPPFSGATLVPGPLPAPRVGPSAVSSIGGGGLSGAATQPPVPGFLHAPPLAASPFPKEADVRPAPTLLAELLGTPTPLELMLSADSAQLPSATPYFMEHAISTAGSLRRRRSRCPGLGPDFAKWPRADCSRFDSGRRERLGSDRRERLEPPLSPARCRRRLARLQLCSPGRSAPISGAWSTARASRCARWSRLRLAGCPPERASPEAARPALSSVESTPHAGYSPELVPDLGSSPGIFDADAIKKDFPILEERVQGATKRLIWLDNAATTQKPRAVIDRLTYFYEHENSNIHRAAHTLAARATDAYEGARERVRRFLNAPSASEIVFTRGATEAINLVAQSWGRRNITAGDEIVLTVLEHHANIVPWQMLAAEKGAENPGRARRFERSDPSGRIREAVQLADSIASFTQVSNALCTITPAREMVEIAHRHGARVLVDGAQTVSHQRVDVQSLDSDFYVFSGHKVFGPTGIGALVRQGRGARAHAALARRRQHDRRRHLREDDLPAALLSLRGRHGQHRGCGVGLGAAIIDYVMSIGLENIARYEHELLLYATEGLCSIPGLTLIGTAKDKAGVLSFVLDGMRTEDVGAALDKEGIAVRSGHHCAQPILRRFGLEATVRASLAPYNTKQDIDALVAAVARLQVGEAAAQPLGLRSRFSCLVW